MMMVMNYANVVTHIKDIQRKLGNRTHYTYFGRRMVGITACYIFLKVYSLAVKDKTVLQKAECKSFQNAVFGNTS